MKWYDVEKKSIPTNTKLILRTTKIYFGEKKYDRIYNPEIYVTGIFDGKNWDFLSVNVEDEINKPTHKDRDYNSDNLNPMILITHFSIPDVI